MRWRLAIQEFDFSVAYIKGEGNNVADGMSRCLPEGKVQEEPSIGARPTLLQYLNGEVEMPPIIPDREEWYALLEREERQQFFVSNEEYTLFCSLISKGSAFESEIQSNPQCHEENGLKPNTVLSPVIASMINGTSNVETLLSSLNGHPLADHEQAPNLPTDIQEILHMVHNA